MIRLALIGCGDIALAQHLPALSRHPGVSLAAVCDTDTNKARAAAERFGPCAWTDDSAEILRDPQVQAVVVATPPWVTPGLTIAALRAGKHVLCEKPMATDVAAAEEVAAAERETGRLVQVGFAYRHGPLMETLRRWIREGRLGGPLLVRISTFDEAWDPTGAPGHYERIMGALRHGPPCLHDGAHAADHIGLLTGARPVRVAAYGLKSRPEFPSANYNAAWVELDSGDCARLEIAWFYPDLPPGEFQVWGPKGRAVLERAAGAVTLESGGQTERVELGEDRVRSCFRAQLEEFLSAIRSGRTPVPGTLEGLASLRLTKAMELSMRTGTPVEV